MVVGKPSSDEGIDDIEGDIDDDENDDDDDIEGPKSGITPLTDVLVVGEKER